MPTITDIDSTQADFQEGTLTDVVADAGGYLRLAIEILDVGFEGAFPPQHFGTSGDASWFQQSTTVHSGTYAAQSGDIDDSQASILTFTAPFDGFLSFWWRVDSESGYDFLEWRINGVFQSRITGLKDWQQVIDVPLVTDDVVEWIYKKDNSVSRGADAGWIDDIVFENPNFYTSGNRISPQLDLSTIGTVESSSIDWTETLNGGTITIETRVSTDNGTTWTAWATCTNGGAIPDLPAGTALLECRQNLSTSDPTVTPQLDSIAIEIESHVTILSSLEMGLTLDSTLSESVPTAPFAMGIGMDIGETRLGVEVAIDPLNLGMSLGFDNVTQNIALAPLETNLAFTGSSMQSIPVQSFEIGLSMDMGEISLGVNVSFEPFSLGMSLDFGSVTQNIALLPVEMGLTFDGSPMQSIPAQPLEIGLSMDLDDVSSFETGSAIIRYFCILTGAADGTIDIVLPMSSFQARRRSGDPTFLSVVIPTLDYADEIAARPNGTLKIEQAYEQNGVIKQTETIMETDLEDVNPDEGGTNQSTTLIGYSTSTYSPKSITLSGVTYRSTRGGKYNYRLARPYIFLNPGDTVTFADDGVTFVIDTMSYFINPATSTIELASA